MNNERPDGRDGWDGVVHQAPHPIPSHPQANKANVRAPHAFPQTKLHATPTATPRQTASQTRATPIAGAARSKPRLAEANLRCCPGVRRSGGFASAARRGVPRLPCICAAEGFMLLRATWAGGWVELDCVGCGDCVGGCGAARPGLDGFGGQGIFGDLVSKSYASTSRGLRSPANGRLVDLGRLLARRCLTDVRGKPVPL